MGRVFIQELLGPVPPLDDFMVPVLATVETAKGTKYLLSGLVLSTQRERMRTELLQSPNFDSTVLAVSFDDEPKMPKKRSTK